MLVLMVFNLCKITACYKVLQIRDRIMIRDDIGDSYKMYVEFCLILFTFFVHLFIINYRRFFLEALATSIFRIIWNIQTHYVV